MNKIKKNSFYYIPHVSTLLSLIIFFIWILFEIPEFHFFYYLFIFGLQALSFSIMKKWKYVYGIRIYLFASFLGIIFYLFNYKNISIQYYIIFLTLFIYFTTIIIFTLDSPENIILTIIFTITIGFNVVHNPDLSLQLVIVVIIFLSMDVFILYTAKSWIVKLNDNQIESLKKTHEVTLYILGRVSELKDLETDNHLKRVVLMIREVIPQLRKKKKYSNYITDKYEEDILSAAYLHDIGKIGISDSLINKTESLTEEEYEIIKTHTSIGYKLLFDAQSQLQEENIYTLALEITRHHHERWDGCGYPDSLKGDQIPLSARIMAVVDVFDALISSRPYKKAYSYDESLEIMKNNSGTLFDPMILDSFLKISDVIYNKVCELI